MKWPKRKPRITDENYGRLMTSFGRIVDSDPLVHGPASALAARIIAEATSVTEQLDARLYRGATEYHLRLLAGAWIIAREGSVPAETARVFEEAVAWRFAPVAKGSAALAHRLSALARGEGERNLAPPDP